MKAGTSTGKAGFIISIIVFIIVGIVVVVVTSNQGYDVGIKEKYGVKVYSPEIITGEFIDVECTLDGGIRIELAGINGQKAILPISGRKCPPVSVGGKGKLTTIIYERCGTIDCNSYIVKSVIE